MSTASQFEKHWQQYCVRLWILEALKAFIVAGMFLAGACLLGKPDFHWLVFSCQMALLLLICGEWGRVHAGQDFALRRLFLQEPPLAEAILATLDFQTRLRPSEPSAYFRARHLQALMAQLEAKKLTKRVPLKLPLAAAAGVVLLLSGVTLTLPSLSLELGAWWQARSFFEDGRSYRILYPAYIRRPPFVQTTLPARLEFPRGSRLEIFFPQETISEAAKKGFSYDSEKGIQPLNWFSQKDSWIAALGPVDSGVLSMRWKGQQTEHRLEVVKDAPPQITVVWPSDPMIFSNSRLPITLTARDDYGLQTIILYYEVRGKAPYGETIQSFEGQFTEYEETYPWELGATPLRKGDPVEAWIEVSDNDALYGPNVVLSEKFRFTVGSIKDYHEDIMERLQKVVADLGVLLSLLDRRLLADTFEQEQAILNDLETLRHDAQYDSLLTEELRQFLFLELKMKILQYQKQRLAMSQIPS